MPNETNTPGVSNSELALVTQLLTSHMDAGVKQINDRFDRFENEIRPKIVEHDNAIVAIQTEKKVEQRWRRWAPPVSGVSVVGMIEGIKALVAYMRHP